LDWWVSSKTNKTFIKKLSTKKKSKKQRPNKQRNIWKIEIEGLNRKGITLIQKDNEQKNIRKKNKNFQWKG
jgi:hypothetical protein